MSGLHGQLPSVQIYYLVPRKAYDEAPEIVDKEAFSVLSLRNPRDRLRHRPVRRLFNK
jgi:hypothetical protein